MSRIDIEQALLIRQDIEALTNMTDVLRDLLFCCNTGHGAKSEAWKAVRERTPGVLKRLVEYL